MEGKGLRVNVDKTKDMKLLYRKKSSVSKVDPCGVFGEKFGCSSIECTSVSGGFIVVVLMYLGRCVYYHVGMSLSLEHVLVIIVL